MKSQRGIAVKNIRLDNDREFTSGSFKNYYKSRGIRIQYTCSYTPQQNSKSERMNRTLMDRTKVKFIETKLPKTLWGEAIRCSPYELNRSSANANENVTPAKKNDLSTLKVFGCYIWKVALPRLSKLDLRARPMLLDGYEGSGYKIWYPEEKKITVSRNIQ